MVSQLVTSQPGQKYKKVRVEGIQSCTYIQFNTQVMNSALVAIQCNSSIFNKNTLSLPAPQYILIILKTYPASALIIMCHLCSLTLIIKHQIDKCDQVALWKFVCLYVRFTDNLASLNQWQGWQTCWDQIKNRRNVILFYNDTWPLLSAPSCFPVWTTHVYP